MASVPSGKRTAQVPARADCSSHAIRSPSAGSGRPCGSEVCAFVCGRIKRIGRLGECSCFNRLWRRAGGPAGHEAVAGGLQVLLQKVTSGLRQGHLYRDGVVSYGGHRFWLCDVFAALSPNQIKRIWRKATLNRYFVSYFVNGVANKLNCYKITHSDILVVHVVLAVAQGIRLLPGFAKRQPIDGFSWRAYSLSQIAGCNTKLFRGRSKLFATAIPCVFAC